jgi:hypothetical protein
MVVSAEDTLPNEVWDSRLGPIFWEKFRESWPDRLYNEDERHLQQYLFMKLSQLNAKEFMVLAKAILSDKPEAKKIISKMVDEVVQILKDYEYEKKMGEKDDDDDIDFDDLDDIDLSSLGF